MNNNNVSNNRRINGYGNSNYSNNSSGNNNMLSGYNNNNNNNNSNNNNSNNKNYDNNNNSYNNNSNYNNNNNYNNSNNSYSNNNNNVNNKRRKNNQEQQQTQQEQEDADKKSQHRRTVDYFTPHGKYMIRKNVYNSGKKRQPLGYIRPDMSYITELPPPSIYQPEVFDLATKFVHVSTNKSKHAIHAIKWTPDARRVLVSSYSGEFTLWNGLTFNFESIMQAHDSPIFSLEYSHNAKWLISGDQSGCIKFWQPNFNNVNILTKAHENAIQDLCFSPTDSKFISCSDDQLLKVWNFTTAEEERVLKGHHWDVKCCDWHSSLGLIVSGSKDNLVKFWDPRDATCLTTIHDFKHTVTKTRFQKIGNERLLAACSRDHSTRIYDIRMMKPMTIIKSQNDADLSSITWHPIHPNVLTIGGYDGSLSTYNLDKSIDVENLRNLGNNELDSTFLTENKMNNLNNVSDAWHRIPHAHDKAIYTLEYHPLGHMLCTAGADKSMRFWCRSRPNDKHGFMDSAYTGESWSEKQQNVAIGDIVNNGDDNNGEITEGQDSIALPGFSLPGFS